MTRRSSDSTRRARLLTSVGLLALVVAFAASPRAQTPLNLRDAIPFDAAVRTGTLANGMRFFIRHNERPATRVTLRLVVKAGSLNETDDQQGLAHFIEHMGFNGSDHFKPGELVSYFESVGARLGPHVNAYTSFDETVYMLDLPTDSAEVVSKGLTAMADFAGGESFLPAEVEKERGVVIEEWRGRLGAGTRLQEKQVPVLYYQSRYADRIPIGKPDTIRAATAERLRAFYDTWYRPERMAIVVVGDVDQAQIEGVVRSAFGQVRARAAAAPPPDQTVPLHQQLLISIASDPEITQTSVSILRKRPRESEGLVGDYRRNLVERLMSDMFDTRFGEEARKTDASFLAAGVGGGGLGPKVNTFSVSARASDGRLVDALTAMLIEARRVREFGFVASELDRAKRSMSSAYERANSERDKTESGSFAQEYVAYVTDGEPSPGIAYEYRLVQQVLPTITLDEVTAMARERLADGSRVLLAVSPEKAGSKQPTEAQLRAAMTAADMAAITPWVDRTMTRGLMPTEPKPGDVVSRRDIADLGVTVVRFSNGIEAWLKPTDFKNDQVLFTMYSPGGTSLATPEEYLNASISASYVRRAGVDGLKAPDLDRLLAGKIASAAPNMSLSSHGISGSASPADLETALQLGYLEFTQPGDDPEAFAQMTRQLDAAAANRGQSPGQVFGECLQQLNTTNHYTSKPLTLEAVRTIERAKMLTFYRQRFANASDFTFFMVGAFKTDDVIPMLAKYVGSLPGSGKRTAEFKDVAIQFPQTTQRVKCEKGLEPRSQTAISFFADPPADPVEREKIAEALTVLETRLRDVLREDLGQTYTVSVGRSQPYPQRGAGYVQVSFGAAPENINAMTDRVLQEIKRLQQDGPPADMTTNAKESAKRAYETNLKENGYWLQRLQGLHELGSDPHEILRRPEIIAGITPDMLKEVFNKYLPMDSYTVVTLMPEGK